MGSIRRFAALLLATTLAGCASFEQWLDKLEGKESRPADTRSAAASPKATPKPASPLAKPGPQPNGSDALDEAACQQVSPHVGEVGQTSRDDADRSDREGPTRIGDEEGFLVNGKKEGEWIQFGKGGLRCGMRTYKANVPEGPWNLDLGDIQMEGRYKAGLPEGPSKSIHKMADGAVRTGTSNYVDGKRHGLWVQVTTGSKKPISCARSEEVFEHGVRVSNTLWHDNGVVSYEVRYRDGLREGELKQWHRNRQPERVQNYRRDQLEGLSAFWHANGKKAREEHYKDGKLDGAKSTWHENGQLASETHFLGGKEVGPFRAWSDRGVLVEHWVMVGRARNYLVSRIPGTSPSSPAK